MTSKKYAARPLVVLLVIIALMATLSTTIDREASAQELITLSGTVTADGVPLAGLTVEDIFGGDQSITDANGDFSVTVDDPEFAPIEIVGDQTADRPSLDITSNGEVDEPSYDADLPALGVVEFTVTGGPYANCSYNAAVLDDCIIDEFCTLALAADGLCDEVQIELDFGVESSNGVFGGFGASIGDTVDRRIVLPVFDASQTFSERITVTAIDGSRYSFSYNGGTNQQLDLGEDLRTRVSGSLTAGGQPLANFSFEGSEARTASDGSFSYSETRPAPFDVQIGGSVSRPPGSIIDVEVEYEVSDVATDLPAVIDLPAIVDLEIVFICAADSCATDRFTLTAETQDVIDGAGLRASSRARRGANVVPVFATSSTIKVREATTTLLEVPWDGVTNPLGIELPESQIVTVTGTVTAAGAPLEGVLVDSAVTNDEGLYEFQTLRSVQEQRLDVRRFDVGPAFFASVGYEFGEDDPVIVDVDLPAVVDLDVQLVPRCGYAEAIVEGCALEGNYFVRFSSELPIPADGDFGAWGTDASTSSDMLSLEVFDVPDAQVSVFSNRGSFTTTWDGSNPFIIEVDGAIAPPEPKTISGTILSGGEPFPGVSVGRTVSDEFGRFTTPVDDVLEVYPTEDANAPDFDLRIPIGADDDEITIELPAIIDLEVQVNTTCLYNRAIIEGCSETGTASSFSLEINDPLPAGPGGSGAWSVFGAVVDGVFTTRAFASDFVVGVGPNEGEFQTSLPWDGTNPFVIDPVQVTGVVQTEDGVPLSNIELIGLGAFDAVQSDEDGSFVALAPPGLSELSLRISNRSATRPDVPRFETVATYPVVDGADMQVVLPRVTPTEVRVNDPGRPAFTEIDGEFRVTGGGILFRPDLGLRTTTWEYRGDTTDSVIVVPRFATDSRMSARVRNLADSDIIGNSLLEASDDGPLFVDVSGSPYIYYRDRDGDLYGDPDSPQMYVDPDRPNRPNGFSVIAGDCNDTDAAVNPDAAEIAGNGVDENCDGRDGVPVAMCLGSPVTIDMRVPGVSGMGTAGDDVILGTSGPDVIKAGGGDDKICAGGGNDTINAGGGDDIVAAGAGDDRIFGLSGNDDLRGWTGEDLIRGGYGADDIDGGPDDDDIKGQAGDDDIRGGDGDDVLRGNRGADRVSGELGDDEVDGGPDADIVRGGPGDDTLIFEPGVDVIVNGGSGSNTNVPE